MAATDLRAQLAEAGETPVGCRFCGRWLAAGRTHDGRPLPQASRRYCSELCREVAAGRRALRLLTITRHHRAQHHDLIHRHELEDAGQLALVDEPLPAIPPLETP